MSEDMKALVAALRKEWGSDRYMNIEEVSTMVGISHRTIARMCKDDSFPKPRKPSPGISRWLYTEVLEWMRTRPVDADDLEQINRRSV